MSFEKPAQSSLTSSQAPHAVFAHAPWLLHPYIASKPGTGPNTMHWLRCVPTFVKVHLVLVDSQQHMPADGSLLHQSATVALSTLQHCKGSDMQDPSI